MLVTWDDILNSLNLSFFCSKMGCKYVRYYMIWFHVKNLTLCLAQCKYSVNAKYYDYYYKYSHTFHYCCKKIICTILVESGFFLICQNLGYSSLVDDFTEFVCVCTCVWLRVSERERKQENCVCMFPLCDKVKSWRPMASPDSFPLSCTS